MNIGAADRRRQRADDLAGVILVIDDQDLGSLEHRIDHRPRLSNAIRHINLPNLKTHALHGVFDPRHGPDYVGVKWFAKIAAISVVSVKAGALPVSRP